MSANRIKRAVGRGLFKIAKILPESNKCTVAKKLRAFAVKLIIVRAGENIDVSKSAVFASSIEIGDRSGIGKNAALNGKVIIGNDVMMGPDVMMYTRNHAFFRLDIPMNKQGITEEKPIIIGDDVWIGARAIFLGGGRYRLWFNYCSRISCDQIFSTLFNYCRKPGKNNW